MSAGPPGRGTILRLLDRLEETVIAALLAAATAVVFAAVVQRYGLANLAALVAWSKAHGAEIVEWLARRAFHTLNYFRLTWAQELAIFMMVWMAKFGAAYGVRTGIHVGVDVLVERLKPPWQARVILAALMAGALFTALVGTLGARLVVHIAVQGQTSAVLEWPMWLVYLAIPLGSYLMCFRFLQVAWRFWHSGDLPRHDPGDIAGLPPAPGEHEPPGGHAPPPRGEPP